MANKKTPRLDGEPRGFGDLLTFAVLRIQSSPNTRPWQRFASIAIGGAVGWSLGRRRKKNGIGNCLNYSLSKLCGQDSSRAGRVRALRINANRIPVVPRAIIQRSTLFCGSSRWLWERWQNDGGRMIHGRIAIARVARMLCPSPPASQRSPVSHLVCRGVRHNNADPLRIIGW